MRVAVITAADGPGGAGLSARQLHEGFRAFGMDSRLFVSDATKKGEYVHAFPRRIARLRAKIEFGTAELLAPDRSSWFSPSLLPDLKWPRVRAFKPDVVSLHWINAGHIGIESLPMLPRPLVWTLHDMWPFTGGCHYDGGCGRYRQACGECPVLGSTVQRDLSRFVHKRKEHAWKELDPVLVVPSDWMARAAQTSRLMANAPVFVVPRPIDTSLFAPVGRALARSSLALPQDAIVLACGAHGLDRDRNKGWENLRSSLEKLDCSHLDATLMLFGCKGAMPDRIGSVKVRAVGFIDDPHDLVRIYNAADLLIMPSKQEAFGRIGAEALSCGTPVVAFRSPGAGELIEDLETGFIVPKSDDVSLRYTLQTALSQASALAAMRPRARAKALEEYDTSVVASQYRNIFRYAAQRYMVRTGI